MLRRIGVLTSLAVTAAMFAGVTSAQADAGYTAAVCVFDGLSGQLSPPITQPPAGLNLTGTYNFTGDANCSARHSDGRTIAPDPDGSNTTITSNGNYHNLACGTGWAYDRNTGAADTTTTVTPDDAAFPAITEVGYEIFFGGGNGQLNIGNGNTTAPSAGGAAIGGHYVGDGVVHITPENREPPNNVGCVTAPTAQFEVAGSFSAAHR